MFHWGGSICLIYIDGVNLVPESEIFWSLAANRTDQVKKFIISLETLLVHIAEKQLLYNTNKLNVGIKFFDKNNSFSKLL